MSSRKHGLDTVNEFTQMPLVMTYKHIYKVQIRLLLDILNYFLAFIVKYVGIQCNDKHSKY